MREPVASRFLRPVRLMPGRAVHTGFASLAPLAVILISPKSSLQYSIDDMIRAAFDELRVVVQERADRFFHMNFPSENRRRFLDDGHCCLLRSELPTSVLKRL